MPQTTRRQFLFVSLFLLVAGCSDTSGPTRAPSVTSIFPLIALRNGFVYVQGRYLKGASVSFRPASGSAIAATVTVSTDTQLTVSVPASLVVGAPLTLSVANDVGSTDFASTPIYAVAASAFRRRSPRG
ncbi:MAG TPA: hypothetical protein VK636_08010 [Gemmatimonadaceae bacterium]|nr:hypothetical protein [Gemmatimonadaceae bacterium]